MEIRTRQFPILFCVAGALFAGLFLAFYLLVFDSIESIFAVQDQATLEELTADAVHRHEVVVRETKILYHSRGVQRFFSAMKGHRPENSMIWDLQQRLLDWRVQFGAGAYRSASYLNAKREPIAVVDFRLHGRYSSNKAESDADVYSSGATEEKTLLSNPVLMKSWSSPSRISSGAYVLPFSDNTQVLRTMFPILDRRSKETIGYFAIDRETPKSWVTGEGKDLFIVDRDRGHIVYLSFDDQLAGQLVDQLQEHLRLTFDVSGEGGLAAVVLTHGGNELLLSRLSEPNSQWEFTMTTRLNPYTDSPRTRGRLLIGASLLFVVIAGLSIYTLTARVHRHSETLEETNVKLEQANSLVSEHNRLLEDELQTAHDLQMRLMPQENPNVTGFDIVGGCIPATEVGGDFYQYFKVTEERLVIALADATGHGMQAAIPTMVFAGLLDTQVGYSSTAEELMPLLNRALYRVLEPRTFICLSICEIDLLNGRLRLSNGGCPYPFVYRASTMQVTEVDLSALPLGVRAESTYQVEEVELAPGDMVVMCSDGIIEAANSVGELYGFERVAEAISHAGKRNMDAQGLIDHLFADVEEFALTEERTDDQTVVVMIRTHIGEKRMADDGVHESRRSL